LAVGSWVPCVSRSTADPQPKQRRLSSDDIRYCILRSQFAEVLQPYLVEFCFPKTMDFPHFNVKLDKNQPEDGIKGLMGKIRPEIDPDDLKFVEFNEGISNKLVGCIEKGATFKDLYLFRLYGNKTELFIDRKMELETFKLLYSKGYGPPVYATFDNGIAYGFVEGDVLGTDTICDAHISKLIAEHMAELHAIPAVGLGSPSPSVFKTIFKFLDIVPDEFPDSSKNKRFQKEAPSKSELIEEARKLKAVLEKHDCPVAFCHNDLLCKNIVFNEKNNKVLSIDYEYANFNPIAHDIGNHFCEYAGVDDVDYSLYPKKDQQIKFLTTAYLRKSAELRGQTNPTITNDDIEKLYIQVNQYALAAHFFWGVWALLQAHFSDIDFDFL
ncbi:hypothetical protein QZH41_015775, partial [Actinostola sp. cb2023]